MSKEKKSNPYVSREFCNERTNRIEAKIDSMKNDILLAIHEKNSIGWKTKASIIGSLLFSVTSIIVAFIQFMS